MGHSAGLRADLYQALGYQDEPENLRPLRNNVADDLSPLAPRIHGPECQHPANAGNYKNQGQRVLAQENSTAADGTLPFGCLLSAEPFS